MQFLGRNAPTAVGTKKTKFTFVFHCISVVFREIPDRKKEKKCNTKEEKKKVYSIQLKCKNHQGLHGHNTEAVMLVEEHDVAVIVEY